MIVIGYLFVIWFVFNVGFALGATWAWRISRIAGSTSMTSGSLRSASSRSSRRSDAGASRKTNLRGQNHERRK